MFIGHYVEEGNQIVIVNSVDLWLCFKSAFLYEQPNSSS